MSSSNYAHRDNKTLMPENSQFMQAMDIQGGPVINAADGGQYGWAPDNFAYVQEQPYVTQRPYCIMLSSPGAFSIIPGGDQLHGLLRAYMETRTRNWSGLSSRTSVEYHDITWAGGSTLSFPIGATRQFGSITHMALDPMGEPFSKLFDTWISYLLSDPVLQRPKAVLLNTNDDLLLDRISASSVYFEPNRNWTDVSHSAVVMAQMPKEGPQYEFSFDVEQSPGRVREISTELTGLIEFDTFAAKEIARAAMRRMALYNPSGVRAPRGFLQPTANLQSDRDSGIVNQMTQAKKNVEKPNYAP